MSQPILFQRIEGLATLIASTWLFFQTGTSWWLFPLLLLVPDLSMAGYLLGNQAGQTIYNLVHTYAAPLSLALLSFAFGNTLLLALTLIWLAHIGMDRAVGYGLKEREGFGYTHLGKVGKGA